MATAGAAEVVVWDGGGGPVKDIGHQGEGEGGEEVFNIQRIRAAAGNENDDEEEAEEEVMAFIQVLLSFVTKIFQFSSHQENKRDLTFL